MSHPEPPPAVLPRPALRWLAAFCALKLWLLGLLSGSPEMHAALHMEAGLADHVCAATLYSQGAENPVPHVVFSTEPQILLITPVSPGEPPYTDSPRGWLRPGRGPPIG